MKTISFWVFAFAFAFPAALAHGQDAATQQLIDQINGQIQNIYSVLDKQDKRISALEKSVGDLQNKLNQPAANNYASADDLKQLAEQVKELAQKQQHDNELILKELEKLEEAGGLPAASHQRPDVSTPASGGPQKGCYYEVKKDDTVIAIARAYSEQFKAKVTAAQILAANPGLDPKNMAVGKKIFIPQPQ